MRDLRPVDPRGDLAPVLARGAELHAARFLRGADPGPAEPGLDAAPRAVSVLRAPMAESAAVADFLRGGCATCRTPGDPPLGPFRPEPPLADPPGPPTRDGCVRYPDGFLQGETMLADALSCSNADVEVHRCAPVDIAPMDPPCEDLPFDLSIDDNFLHKANLDFAQIEVIENDGSCAARRELVEAALHLLVEFAKPGEVLDWVLTLIEQSACNGVDRRWPDCVAFDSLQDVNPLGLFVKGVVFQLLRPSDWGVVAAGLPSLRIYLDTRWSATSFTSQPWYTHTYTAEPGFDAPTFGGYDETRHTDPNVYVNLLHQQAEHILGQWLWGSNDERTCAVLRLSALLFHEVLHLAHLGPGYDPSTKGKGEDECNPWHVIVNTYLWAAAQRLGWRGEAPLCCDFAKESNFFSDCWNYPLRTETIYGYEGPAHCVVVGGVDVTACTRTPPSEVVFGEELPVG